MRLRVTLIAALALLPAVLPAGQVPTGAASAFPEKLLEGMPEFTFALQLFSDIRGNFGPCG